jgi:hypothetical protein
MIRTTLPRGVPLKRKTPLRSVSPKRRSIQRERREMVRRELSERELCEAGAPIYHYQVGKHGEVDVEGRSDFNQCGGLAVDLHEPVTRARGGSILDPKNTVAVCRICHGWIHDNPEAATTIGLLRSRPR